MFTAMKKDGTHTIILHEDQDRMWWRRDFFTVPHIPTDQSIFKCLPSTRYLEHAAIIDKLDQDPDWIVTQHNPQETAHEQATNSATN